MNSVGLIIFSRYSSSRLPGKALRPIDGKPMVGYIIDKLKANFSQYPIMLATSDESSDDPIAAFGAEQGIQVFRGSLENVALRFLKAAESLGVDYAVRITGDSLFLDPYILRTLISKIDEGNYDLISNRFYKSYPVGQTMEVIKVSSYRKNYERFSSPDDFEHVSQYYYDHMADDTISMYHYANPDGIHRDISLAIDTPEDFETATKVIKHLGDKVATATYKDVVKLYKAFTAETV